MKWFNIAFLAAAAASCSALARDLSFVPQAVHWESCNNGKYAQWFDQNDIPERMQCAYIDAPLSYDDDAKGKRVKLAATRLPATGQRLGSLLSIAGGPGIAGILTPLEPDTLNDAFDIIGYDARGVGQSRPKISCPKMPDGDNDIVRQESEGKRWVEGCVRQTAPAVIKHVGTDEAVNDVDVIRAALGEDKLNVIGYSYGTQVAAMYAERFPARVNAMVLDGVVDLTDDAFTSDYKQAFSFQKSFERFAAYCKEGKRCPLQGADLTASYHALLNRVDEMRLSDADGEEIGSDNIMRATANTLYASENWPKLAKLLRSIGSNHFAYATLAALENKADEEDTSVAMPRSSRFHARANKSTAEQEEDNLMVISCADSALPGFDIRQSRRKEQQLAEASAFSNYPLKHEFPRNKCDYWPFKGKVNAHVPVVSSMLPPLLFVAQRNDPATPYQGAKAMAGYFHSPLISVNGDGHTIALSDINQCVDDEVIDYLINPLAARSDKQC